MVLCADDVLAVPLSRALGMALLDPDSPAAGAWFEAGEMAGNGVGGVHSSAVNVLVELAGYLAVAGALVEGEHAVTHALSVQLISGASLGQRVEARGELVHRGGRVAFVSVEVTSGGERVAVAQVTKSVVRARSATAP